VAAQLAHFHKKMGLLHQEIEVEALHRGPSIYSKLLHSHVRS
jgi:hypothetical protein